MGYAKLVITLIKYTPAAYWNYQRKSTEGWSIINILLDLLGGVFSFASGGLSIENGLNLVKVILAFITVAYDILFCIQHYCLYRKKNMANIYVKDEQLADSLIIPSE
jgi:cystinosin